MAEEHHSSISGGAKAPPGFNRAFQEMFQEAFRSMIKHPEFYPIFEDFRIAYTYRRQFPWLPESKDTTDEVGMNGLSYALRTALYTYMASPRRELSISKDTDKKRDWLDTDWANQLLTASDVVIYEGFGLKHFEKSITKIHEDATSITLETLYIHIAAALARYYKRHQIGIAPDPI
jgi:hypothetical protein